MSQQLYQAGLDILAMPHYLNDHAAARGKHLHEKAVAKRLLKNGFIEYTLTGQGPGRKLLTKAFQSNDTQSLLEKLYPNMPKGSFIVQPAGSQAFPDILVRDFCGRFVRIECKSTKSAKKPMYNDNFPGDALYIFSNKKLNKTTLYTGRGVQDIERARDIRKRQTDEYEQINKKYAAEWAKCDVGYDRNFILTYRPYVQQKGKNTDYFVHHRKAECEQAALDFLKQ